MGLHTAPSPGRGTCSSPGCSLRPASPRDSKSSFIPQAIKLFNSSLRQWEGEFFIFTLHYWSTLLSAPCAEETKQSNCLLTSQLITSGIFIGFYRLFFLQTKVSKLKIHTLSGQSFADAHWAASCGNRTHNQAATSGHICHFSAGFLLKELSLCQVAQGSGLNSAFQVRTQIGLRSGL